MKARFCAFVAVAVAVCIVVPASSQIARTQNLGPPGEPAADSNEDVFLTEPSTVPPRSVQRTPPTYGDVETYQRGSGRGGIGASSRGRTRRSPQRDYQLAVAAVRDAENDDDRSSAQQQLREVLGQMFDADLAERNKDLEAIEQRVVQLRAQLDRRHEKRQEIINLQLQVIENEADGLGFFHSSGGRGATDPYGRGRRGFDLMFGRGGEFDASGMTPGAREANPR